MPVTVIVTVLIHFGTIFGVLAANEGISRDVSDIRAVRGVFGVFDKWYISFLPIK